MKNLIFGGRGLIGGALHDELLRRGEQVEIYDLKDGWDLRHKLPPSPAGRAFVWFLAWDVGGANYIMDPRMQAAILENNVALCQSVYRWLRTEELPFLFTSTQMAGYPNAYGLTKQMGEYWATQLARGHVCRLWNVYGAEPSSVRSHVISDLVHQGRSGRISLRTSGLERRQFICAHDCALALIHQRDSNAQYADITSGEWVPVRRIAEIVGRLMNAEVTFDEKSGYESLVDPSQRLPGWNPMTSLEKGIRQVIDASSSLRAA